MLDRSCLFLIMLAANSGRPALAQEDPPVPTQATSDRFSVVIGADYTSQYFFRGIVQEDDGLIFQPYAELGFSLIDNESWSLDLFAGTWSSIHSETATADPNATLSSYYELDLYAGLSASFDAWTVAAQYIAYTSPSSAFSTIQEIDVSLYYDDSESPLLGRFSLSPYVAVAMEIGENAADGGENGIYLELGISPSYTFDAESKLRNLTLAVPMSVGLNLGDYYEYNGGDDAFGFVDIGFEASFPIDLGDGSGELEAYIGLHGLFMSDDLASINSNDDSEVIVSAGVSLSF